MTRLIAEQVLEIPGKIREFDQELTKKTGSSLKDLALEASGFDSAAAGSSVSNPDSDSGFGSTTSVESKPSPVYASVNGVFAPLAPVACPVAVIPVTAGEGTIKGFSEALCAIAAYLGFPAFITKTSDVSGLVEAYQRDATIALMADDHLYAALNLKTRRIAGNDEATAKGYTVALRKMAGGLAKKEVFLIGLGPLGTAAALALLQEGAGLIVYDLVKDKEAALLKNCTKEEQQRITSGLSLEQVLSRTNLIFDASPGGAFIPAALLPADAIISAPGLPLGLDSTAAQKFADRLIHEPLQIGTAVMLFQALV